MPASSNLARIYRGHEEWTTTDELVAILAEIAWMHYRSFLRAFGVSKSRLPKPLQIPRPYKSRARDPQAAPTSRRPANVDEVIALLQMVHGQKR